MKICDTTLRDGEQMPSAYFNIDEKLELTKKILDFGIDLIEIMPSVSKDETRLAEILISDGLKEKIVSSTPLNKSHIELNKSLGLENITLFTSLSDIHLKYKLKISRNENLSKALEYIEYAKELGLNISFAGEDSTRADESYLINFINSLNGNLNYFLICDTVGCLTPEKTKNLIQKLKQETDCKIGLHFHNDFGLATANTLKGIASGADLFSGTFTGIGERAGNTPIEEVVTSLRYQYNKELPLKYQMIKEICKAVSKYSGIKLQKHKPICGENVFTHESGMHVDGILKNPLTYQNFPPEEIGRETKIVYGKHSGENGLRNIFGNRFSEEEYKFILSEIKQKSQLEKKTFSREKIIEMYNG